MQKFVTPRYRAISAPENPLSFTPTCDISPRAFTTAAFDFPIVIPPKVTWFNGELDALSYAIAGNNLYGYTLTRDLAGRITQKVETLGGATDTHDYTYDANGNRIQETNAFKGITDLPYTFSAEDHLITAGPDIYQFDPDGFLIRKTTPSGIMTTTYSSRGELFSATLPGGTTVNYDHDPMGRRIAKRVNGNITEKYLWTNATTLLAVYDASDNLLIRFTYADSRTPFSMTYNGYTYYLAYDQIGSLKVVSDSTGNIIKQIDYDSFGSIINDTNPSLRIPFGFAGGLHDRDTNLVRFGARDYDPSIGRWTAKDPIDFAGRDTNLYGYVINDPVNWIDPFGLLAAPWHFGVSLVAGFNSGMGVGSSLSFAWNAMAVDFAPGSQGLDAATTAQHAMAGLLPTGKRQTPQQAIDAANNFIQSNKDCGKLARAGHATQDLATPGHAGQPWRGFGWNWDTISHILGDIFPSPRTLWHAYQNTLGVLY